jgi:hypothetical protein
MSPETRKKLRWFVAALIVAGGTFLVSRGWTMCEDKLATTGTNAVVRVCRPLAITDPPVAGALLLVVLLLLPDLAEVGIPGFLTLKRRVEQQEEKVDQQAIKVEEQEAKIANLITQLAQSAVQQQAVSQTSAAQGNAVNVNLYDFQAAIKAVEPPSDQDLASTKPLFAADSPTSRTELELRMLRTGEMVAVLARVAPSASAAEEEERLEKEIEERKEKGEEKEEDRWYQWGYDADQWSKDLDEAKRERRQLLYGDDESRRISNESDKVLRSALASWFDRHREPMQLVVAARDAVLRQEPIDDTKLAEAVDLAEGLLHKWAGWRDGAFNQPAAHH